MKTDEFDYVALGDLRVGLFVDLDLGWLAHPFSTSRFKIATERQIETLKTLDVDRIRYIPSKSDSIDDAAEVVADREHSAADVATRRTTRTVHPSVINALGAEQCERRFTETTQQYRQAMEMVETNPKGAAQLCQEMVHALTTEMLQQSDIAIRILTEVAGDKSAMHPVNVTVISLLLGKALDELGLAAFLHDMGKIKLPERVRRWESNFSSGELKVYQDHVAESVNLARQMKFPLDTIKAISQHHEMVDGSGFPLRIRGDHITECAHSGIGQSL